MDLDGISEMAKLKGIQLMGTADFTHPAWFAHLKEKLNPSSDGLFEYNGVTFVLAGEVCNIYTKNGRLRKNHNVIIVPGFAEAERVTDYLSRYGKIESDGRPILSLDAEKMFERIMDLGERNHLIAAHIWTPWFSLFGSKSGFESIEECFGKYAKKVLALETGLSSDPQMNWMWSELDPYTLVSNSDAHSPENIGREANCFACELEYDTIMHVVKEGDPATFLFTVEFYPEEGKYHFDGHRACDVSLHPDEAMKSNNRCPRCGKPLTVGVLHRIYELADRPYGFVPPGKVPSRKLVPLIEILAAALNCGKGTKTVEKKYRDLIARLGSEFEILMDMPHEEIKQVTNGCIADYILKVRNGEVKVKPGYDGVYGEVRISGAVEQEEQQLELF